MNDGVKAQQSGEYRRTAWLLANRATLIAVGICWLGMITWELVRHHTPVFLIAMVPVFALLRLVFFYRFSRKGRGNNSS